MGIEYKLRTARFDQASVYALIAALHGAKISDSDSCLIEYRREGVLSGSMPDAFIQIETDSVYFRNNSNCGNAFFGAVVAKLCSLGTVSIEEL